MNFYNYFIRNHRAHSFFFFFSWLSWGGHLSWYSTSHTTGPEFSLSPSSVAHLQLPGHTSPGRQQQVAPVTVDLQLEILALATAAFAMVKAGWELCFLRFSPSSCFIVSLPLGLKAKQTEQNRSSASDCSVRYLSKSQWSEYHCAFALVSAFSVGFLLRCSCPFIPCNPWHLDRFRKGS